MAGKGDDTGIEAVVRQIRALTRELYEPPVELRRLSTRIRAERKRTHEGIVEQVAREAGIDLEPIYARARRRNTAKRRLVTELLARLEPRAVRQAEAEKARLHAVRAGYLKDFAALEAARTQLKFKTLQSVAAEATPGECNVVFGSACSDPDPGTFDASAATSSDPNGIWLHPLVRNDNGDCGDDATTGTTFHSLTYTLDPPGDASFAADRIRVDLIGNGTGTSKFGDPGFLTDCNPYYVHSFIDLHVSIAQLVNGEWLAWPLLTDRIFEGKGEYSRQIRLVLSGQTYPAAIVVRNPAAGGGQLLCQVEVVCSTNACGDDGRTAIDFRQGDLGMFLGGVTLLGSNV